jgi:integrase
VTVANAVRHTADGRVLPTGIDERHARSCLHRRGLPCSCRPCYVAWVFDRRAKKKLRRSFSTLAAARGWRIDALAALRRGTLRAPKPITLRQAAEAWLEGARSGSIRTRSGDPYKPSVLGGYEAALERRILPELGARKLGQIARLDLQDLADLLCRAAPRRTPSAPVGGR